ncbi:MAG: NADP-dependent oxidoreductase, partial [Coxiellaceae bacterium]|nr:NADP-dependent oxidoreductase [Coxiellaceae bacterium]
KEAPIQAISNGEALVKTLYLSFDPTQRGWATMDTYMPAIPLGTPMRAFSIGQVVESKSKKYKVGDIVSGVMTWQEYVTIADNTDELFPPLVIPGFLDLELTLALSLTGLTAYFGLLEIGKPQPGETVLVSGAAGATGSIVAQIAKLKGARVVGIAGGADKCKWLKDVAKVDEAIDYKSEDVMTRIQETCPNGVNVFYDNVGGETLDAALLNLAHNARVVLCGAISQYNKLSADFDLQNQEIYGVKSTTMLIITSSRMQGFILSDYQHKFMEGLLVLDKW